MVITLVLFCLFGMFIGMILLWGLWIWIGKDGGFLADHLRPSFFRFWFVITPRFLLGLPTGMEKYTLAEK